MNFLTSVLLQQGSYCLVQKSFGLSCLQSRTPVERCELWAVWMPSRARHVLSFQALVCFHGVFILVLDTCELVPCWGCTSFLPVVKGCSLHSVLSLLLSAPLCGTIFLILRELHLMFLSFQGGNLILSVGGIWRPRPGEKPSLYEQEELDVAIQKVRQQPCWGSSQTPALPLLHGPWFVAA